MSDSGDVRVDDDGRLIIEAVKVENAGNYTCVAENIAGKMEKPFELIVTSRPVIFSGPQSVTIDENEEAVLSCDYEAKSEAHTTVTWKKDGKPIKHSEGNCGTSTKDNLQTFPSPSQGTISGCKSSRMAPWLFKPRRRVIEANIYAKLQQWVSNRLFRNQLQFQL